MNLDLQGKTAFILGGSKGLGFGVAEALAAEGVDLALVARDRQALDHAAQSLRRRFGVRAFAIPADLTDFATLAAAVDEATHLFGQEIDILLNNTGGPPPGGVSSIDPNIWKAQFDAMVLSVIGVTDLVAPKMRDRGCGRILTITSSVVVEPNPSLGLSNTLRSALVGWSKTLAGELAPHGVTVNLLLPGVFATERALQLETNAAERTGRTVSQIRADRLRTIPVGRYGTAAEFGAVAAFLASKSAAYITGSAIRVDGGMLRSV